MDVIIIFALAKEDRQPVMGIGIVGLPAIDPGLQVSRSISLIVQVRIDSINMDGDAKNIFLFIGQHIGKF